MRSTSRELCWFALAFSLGAACGGNTEREASDPDATGGAAGASGAAGGSARGGGTGNAGASGSSGTSSGAAGVVGTSGGNAGSGNTGGDGSGGSTFGNGGSAGVADAGTDTCSLPADSGACLAAITRFFYDPVTARCREFTYGGCGGNLNNFMTLADCEAKCAHRADRCRSCGTDSCTDHNDCSACPLNGDVTGLGCTTPGLECTYGGCGPICTCRAGPAAFAWACIILPC